MDYTDIISRIKSGEEITLNKSKVVDVDKKGSEIMVIESENLNVGKLKEILSLYRNFNLTFTAVHKHIIIYYEQIHR